jgi:VWFA-related protein
MIGNGCAWTCCAAGVCLAGGFALAQETVFKAGVAVVNITATVRDSAGRFAGDLGKDDFTVLEEGVEQTVSYFSRDAEAPVTIGLLVDTSLSQRRTIEEQKAAAGRFLDRVFHTGKDQGFVIRFDSEVELVQDRTDSRERLHRAIAELRTREPTRRMRFTGNQQLPGGGIPLPGGRRRGGPFPGGRGPGGPSPGGPGPGGPGTIRGVGTALYDAVFLASEDVLGGQEGRKAIVLISDGIDLGSKVTLDRALRAAHAADAVIYSIYYMDEEVYARAGRRRGGRSLPDGRQELGRLSEETGGRFYEPSKRKTLDTVFEEIAREIRNQYSLGYSPSAGASADAFRWIEVRVNRPGYKVYARSGYYPRSD